MAEAIACRVDTLSPVNLLLSLHWKIDQSDFSFVLSLSLENKQTFWLK